MRDRLQSADNAIALCATNEIGRDAKLDRRRHCGDSVCRRRARLCATRPIVGVDVKLVTVDDARAKPPMAAVVAVLVPNALADGDGTHLVDWLDPFAILARNDAALEPITQGRTPSLE